MNDHKNEIRVLDLFHGAGGSSLGAKNAGARIVGGIDFWKPAYETFKLNFPDAIILSRDIRSIHPKDVLDRTGHIDLILASPECTNHSCAKGAKTRCEKSKMTAFEVVRFAKIFMPRWIVLENVIQMAKWHKQQVLISQLEELGYNIRLEKLESSVFGVPQSRKRLFIICDLEQPPSPITMPKEVNIQTANSIIDNDANYRFNPLYTPRRAQATIERARRAISKLGKKTPFIIVYYGTDGGGGWQTVERPLRTITTVDRFAYVKPTKNGHYMRMLQPEELKIGMGFPPNFRLELGTRRERVKLMGNAVCPPVMEHIVKSICHPRNYGVE